MAEIALVPFYTVLKIHFGYTRILEILPWYHFEISFWLHENKGNSKKRNIRLDWRFCLGTVLKIRFSYIPIFENYNIRQPSVYI